MPGYIFRGLLMEPWEIRRLKKNMAVYICREVWTGLGLLSVRSSLLTFYNLTGYFQRLAFEDSILSNVLVKPLIES